MYKVKNNKKENFLFINYPDKRYNNVFNDYGYELEKEQFNKDDIEEQIIKPRQIINKEYFNIKKI